MIPQSKNCGFVIVILVFGIAFRCLCLISLFSFTRCIISFFASFARAVGMSQKSAAITQPRKGYSFHDGCAGCNDSFPYTGFFPCAVSFSCTSSLYYDGFLLFTVFFSCYENAESDVSLVRKKVIVCILASRSHWLLADIR